jgi:hypothetical protein
MRERLQTLEKAAAEQEVKAVNEQMRVQGQGKHGQGGGQEQAKQQTSAKEQQQRRRMAASRLQSEERVKDCEDRLVECERELAAVRLQAAWQVKDAEEATAREERRRHAIAVQCESNRVMAVRRTAQLQLLVKHYAPTMVEVADGGAPNDAAAAVADTTGPSSVGMGLESEQGAAQKEEQGGALEGATSERSPTPGRAEFLSTLQRIKRDIIAEGAGGVDVLVWGERSKLMDLSDIVDPVADPMDPADPTDPKKPMDPKNGARAGLKVRAPHEFVCPVTLQLLRDPVIASDGHTYERDAIERWLQLSSRSPKTNLPLDRRQLTPNVALRNIIGTWVEGQRAAAGAMAGRC